MEMKLPEQVHQVCRLCGQFESIYIDIFGEEGTRRLLGLKIHSKINILIDETDPLPKTICVQCLGKLEFVCDFQEECLRTQQLLRDQYDVPSRPNVEEKITEEETIVAESIAIAEPASTSTNNISTDKNHNSTADIENVDPTREENFKDATESTEITAKPKRTRTSPQTRSKNSDKDTNERVVDETSNRRWLRSRNITESRIKTRKKSKSKTISLKKTTPRTKSSLKEGVSIVTRLRSQNQNQTRANLNSEAIEKTSDGSSASKPQEKIADEKGMIQIPTSALNKVLTAVSSSPEVEVSVKESNNRNGDIEDISFTLELRKKQETESTVTVLARVFPDQGSCLVGSEIINLLENESNSELSQIINSIVKGKNSKDKDLPTARTAELEELEKRLSSISDSGGGGIISSRNPEELFRIDGEEIRVDDNVESTTVDGQSGYSCKLCRKFYERRDKCTVHVKTHLGIKQYACTLCVAKFVCKSDVMKHIRCSHTNPRPMQCPKCPKRFRSKFDLTEHDNVHQGIKPYQCSDCGQSYHHKVSLQMHVKSHLPPQNLACEYCGKVFPFRTRLLSHIGSVHLKNRRNFRCRFCYNLYSSLAVLNDHIKTRHATTYTCEICSKTFKVASKYKAHVLQHSNPKPFVCNVCNNRYASKAFLNEHLLKHEGLRKHVCQKCGASFAQASHLAAHRHVHGEKTHACPECGRKFNRRDNMKVHRKRHFAESGRIVTTDNKNQTGISDKSTPSPASVDTSDSNEKVEENDGSSQVICAECLGILGSPSDFYENRHETPSDLKDKAKQENHENSTGDSESTDEYKELDKENELPPDSKSSRATSREKIASKCKKSTCLSKQEFTTNATNLQPDSSSIDSTTEVISRVLADITDQHQQRPKSNLCKQLFPLDL